MTARRACVLLLAAASSCAAPPPVRLADLEGHLHAPGAAAASEVHVLVWTSQECPIANSYAPTLRDLAASWSASPVRLFLIHVDPDLGPEAARAHANEYELPGTILFDPEHRLARAFGVTKTPEAVVLRGPEIVYRGRIDDAWHSLGAAAPPGHHDLRDAVATALAGRTVPEPHPPTVGCLLPEPRP